MDDRCSGRIHRRLRVVLGLSWGGKLGAPRPAAVSAGAWGRLWPQERAGRSPGHIAFHFMMTHRSFYPTERFMKTWP